MVKKKGKSKRIALKDKYKIQRRTVETNRKRRKQAKRDEASGKARRTKKRKDPGIPNSWPFKQDLLKETQRTRERAQLIKQQSKQQKQQQQQQQPMKTDNDVDELLKQASADQQQYETKQQHQQQQQDGAAASAASDAAAGQQSRRAYLRDLKQVIDQSDVVLQVMDARDPVGTRLPSSVDNAILSQINKKMILVLNKIDLVPSAVTKQWLTHLRQAHPTIAMNATSSTSSSSKRTQKGGDGDEDHGDAADDAGASTSTSKSNKAMGTDGLLQLIKNYARTDADGTGNKKANSKKTAIVVGLIGLPNTGKSSIINALATCKNKKKKHSSSSCNSVVTTSARPGCTKAIQEIVIDRHVRILDTPGVVFNDAASLSTNCLDVDSMEDPIHVVDQVIMARCDPTSLMMKYNVPAFPQNADGTQMFLAMIAKQYGRVLPGGVPDKASAARFLLKDWNTGRIPYYTPVPADFDDGAEEGAKKKKKGGDASSTTTDAKIVSQFGKEFDLWDDYVFSQSAAKKKDSSSKNGGDDEDDEMEYVQLNPQAVAGVNDDEDAAMMDDDEDESSDDGSDSDEDDDDEMED